MISNRVADVMTTKVVTVGLETPLKEVARLMIGHAVSGLPVVDETGRVVGIVSEADLLIKERGTDGIQRRPLARIFGESAETQQVIAKVEAVTAQEAMTAPPITIEADRPVREAADLMIERQVNRLPVVDLEGRLLGIVTRADIVRAFTRPDEELIRFIRDEVMVKSLWLDPEELELHIARGVVDLHGTVDRRSTAEILERLIGQVDGVVAVRSDLDWRLDDSRIEAEKSPMVFPITQR